MTVATTRFFVFRLLVVVRRPGRGVFKTDGRTRLCVPRYWILYACYHLLRHRLQYPGRWNVLLQERRFVGGLQHMRTPVSDPVALSLAGSGSESGSGNERASEVNCGMQCWAVAVVVVVLGWLRAARN